MDQTTPKSHYRAASTFDEKKAGEDFSIAVLPIVYERALNDGMSPEDARGLVGSRLKAGDSFEIVRHQNTTAVIVHQPASGRITVAFDGTEEFRDMLDNFRFSEVDHPLGGKVHKGHFLSIATRGVNADNDVKLSDRVKAIVKGYAASGEGVKDLTMTGHSRGGALTMAATAEWMHGGLPENTRLTDVQTFGALPYGNAEFIQNFMNESAKQGTRVTRVIAGNDAVPTYMASPKPGFDMYTHGGDVVYLLPDQAGSAKSTLVNPDEAVLQAARSKLENRDWHNPDTYADMLGVPSAKLPPVKSHPYQEVPTGQLQLPSSGLPVAAIHGARSITP